MNPKSPILLIDSGIGGLYIYKALKQHLPFEQFYYLADTAYFPYGNQTKETIKDRFDFLLQSSVQFKPKLIVLACNTLSLLQQKHEELPIIDTLESIQALADNLSSPLYVLATKLSTTQFSLPSISLGSLASQIEYNQSIELNKFPFFQEMQKSSFLLGCTHYSWVQKELSSHFPQHAFIDPTPSITQQVILTLRKMNLLCSHKLFQLDRFFVTQKPEDFAKRAQRFIGIIKVESLSTFISAL